jgi:hypothetical protein
MSLYLVGHKEDGTPIYSEEPPKPPKLKRTVVRCLGRIEQICACAERILDRSDAVRPVLPHGADRNA